MKYKAPDGSIVEIFYYFGMNVELCSEFIGSKILVDCHNIIFTISQGNILYIAPNSHILKRDNIISVLSDSDMLNYEPL